MLASSIMKSRQSSENRKSHCFWLLIAFFVLVFLTGGSSRSDVASLMVLRPVSIFVCGLGMWSLRREHFKQHQNLFIFAALMLGLVVLYLIPLPFAIWMSLPGHTLVEHIDSAAILRGVHRPAAINPVAGFDTLFWFCTPMAVLILGAQLGQKERALLLFVIMGLTLLSGFVGLAQLLGDSAGDLYFYRVTNNGSSVGLFANRNHQAIMLAMIFPMLVVFANRSAGQNLIVRKWIAFSSALFIVPLLLVTGSRAGVFAGIFGVAAAAVVYHRSQPASEKRPAFITQMSQITLAIAAIVSLGVVTNFFSRAVAIDRMLNDGAQESRLDFWKPVIAMTQHYLPIGTGPGGFADAYRVIEPVSLLDSTYLNRAHNDWLETIAEFGLLGAVLLASVVAWATILGVKAFTDSHKGQNNLFACLGFVIIMISAIGSAGDYPLRTPAIAAVTMLAAIWLSSRTMPQKTVI